MAGEVADGNYRVLNNMPVDEVKNLCWLADGRSIDESWIQGFKDPRSNDEGFAIVIGDD